MAIATDTAVKMKLTVMVIIMDCTVIPVMHMKKNIATFFQN